jgi:hypothetical protein
MEKRARDLSPRWLARAANPVCAPAQLRSKRGGGFWGRWFVAAMIAGMWTRQGDAAFVRCLRPLMKTLNLGKGLLARIGRLGMPALSSIEMNLLLVVALTLSREDSAVRQLRVMSAERAGLVGTRFCCGGGAETELPPMLS